MKKLFSKILIGAMVLGIFLAPVSILIENKSFVKIEKNTVLANLTEITITSVAITGENTITVSYTSTGALDTDEIVRFLVGTGGNNSSSSFLVTNHIKNNSNGNLVLSLVGQIEEGKTYLAYFRVEEKKDSVGINLLFKSNIYSFTKKGGAKELFDADGKLIRDFDYNCQISGPGLVRCLLWAIYSIVFVPISWMAHLAGVILDFFVHYSISSDSYQSSFIETGWATIRDIANIFFILALLYVAIKTVLGLNASNNKKVITMIIIMALLINFSLFFTKVVIDSSNILAKIFYSNIRNIDENRNLIVNKDGEAKSISAGLVGTFNPQKIFKKALKENELKKDNQGTYATILLMAIIIVGTMIFIFFSVALVFVSRVIMLWLLMVFSPIAFASYTIPSMKIPGFGHQEWWKELFNNAFLAPIFIFFLYLITAFNSINERSMGSLMNPGNVDPGDTKTNAETLALYMKVLIPLILVLVLLKKAKDITIKMSGEMGAIVSKAGSALGKGAVGLAGGAALGAAAFGGTKLIGGLAGGLQKKYGEKFKSMGMNEDGTAKKGVKAFMSRQIGKGGLKTFDKTMKSSFDLRQTKLGGALATQSKLNLSNNLIGLGPKSGGLAGARDRKAGKIEKTKELYKTTMSDSETKTWSLERMDKYQQAKQSGKYTKDELDKKYGEGGPKLYTKTDELNKDRMDAFKDAIGVGLLGSVAQEFHKKKLGVTQDTVENEKSFIDSSLGKLYLKKLKTKNRRDKLLEAEANGTLDSFDANKEDSKFDKKIEDMKTGVKTYELKYDTKTLEAAQEEFVQKTKMQLGVAVGIGAMVVGGGVGAGMLGAVGGSAVGGAIGGGVGVGAKVGGDVITSSLATKKVIKSMEKESVSLEKVQARIEELNNILERAKTLHEPGIGSMGGPPIELFDNNRLNYEKLRDAISSNQVDIKESEALLQGGDSSQKDLLKELYTNREILNSLKTAEKQLLDLGDKKSKIGNKGSSSKSSSRSSSGSSSSSSGSSGGGTPKP